MWYIEEVALMLYLKSFTETYRISQLTKQRKKLFIELPSSYICKVSVMVESSFNLYSDDIVFLCVQLFAPRYKIRTLLIFFLFFLYLVATHPSAKHSYKKEFSNMLAICYNRYSSLILREISLSLSLFLSLSLSLSLILPFYQLSI